MTEVGQGTGWWVASDGRWYPPDLHPSRMPPTGENLNGPTSSPQTNGLAIASLVLSLTVFVIGPILAVIFGVMARRQIRESRGTQAGDGLALAGLSIGIVELALSLVIGTVVIVLIANGSISGFGQHDLAISGASGYTTTAGEAGLPLAERSPWGHPCQPIVFQVSPTMPTQQYDLIEQAVDSARALGVDVTIETPKLLWHPSSLYPAGQTNATVRFVPIFPSTQPPPNLSDGHVERIQFGWDTKISGDRRNEVFSDLQATIYLAAVRGDPQATERATRELVALSQGVADSTSPGSSIAQGNMEDAYSSQDVAAMQRMSGCTFEPTTQPRQTLS